MHLGLLLILFFVSGACGLIYEVVWIRLLSLTLSITVYALTTVLCAFMAGLGLGAAWAGAIADRIRRPLAAFGLAEIGVGICGLLVPAVLYGLSPAYIWLRQLLSDAPVLFTAGRFLLAFLVLVVPATLMGTTLPFLSRAAIVGLGTVGRPAGALYGVNAVGAVAGTVAAGFWLIPELGLRVTSTGAAALNFLIGAAALWLARRETRARAQSKATAPTRAAPPSRGHRQGRIATLVFTVSGFTALGYEVLWTRALEPFTHNSTYAYTAMLAMFLLGIGAGSLFSARYADRLRRPVLALGSIQIAIAGTVLAALFVYTRFEHGIPVVVERLGGIPSWPRVVTLIFAEASVTMLATALLFGATFPLVARAVVDTAGRVGRRIGTAYAANTAGSILGALVVGFGMLPSLGVRNAFVAMMACNLAVGALAVASELAGARRRAFVVASLLALVAIPIAVPPDFFRRGFIERYGPLLFYREEVTDTVMVTEGDPGGRWLRFGDGRGTAGTGSYIEDRMYAHIPLALHPDPRRVLQITFGVGNSLASVARHPVERIDCVELSPGVTEAASFFESTNRGVLRDPRVNLIIDDGRNYLLTSRDRYDVIRLDPPELHTRGVVNLYTREFYESARGHLAEGGIFSIWVNAVMTPIEDLRLLVRTTADVFPYVSIWHGPAFYSWVINGSEEPHPPDLQRLGEVFTNSRVRSDLESIGVATPYHFLRHFIMAGSEVKRFVGEGPLVTDDRTILDFTVPRAKDASFGIGNLNTGYWLIQLIEPGRERNVVVDIFLGKLNELSRFKRPVLPHVVNVAASGLSIADVAQRIEAAGTKE